MAKWSNTFSRLPARNGAAYARAGAIGKADQILHEISPRVDRGNDADTADLHILEGEIALARGNYAQAIENLQRGAVSSPLPLGLAGMARAYRKAGDTGQAIDCYEKLIALGIRALGWEPQQFWLAAHADLAELYLSRGERAKAAQTLDELARLWKNAYPDLPLVRRMRELQQR